ncbi:MAG: hypothetical protein LBJ20_04555 [Candidatus Methanoplasma sp.]|nr:hypothetical protein [Candidatus Methanoplasma sp.]
MNQRIPAGNRRAITPAALDFACFINLSFSTHMYFNSAYAGSSAESCETCLPPIAGKSIFDFETATTPEMNFFRIENLCPVDMRVHQRQYVQENEGLNSKQEFSYHASPQKVPAGFMRIG